MTARVGSGGCTVGWAGWVAGSLGGEPAPACPAAWQTNRPPYDWRGGGFDPVWVQSELSAACLHAAVVLLLDVETSVIDITRSPDHTPLSSMSGILTTGLRTGTPAATATRPPSNRELTLATGSIARASSSALRPLLGTSTPMPTIARRVTPCYRDRLRLRTARLTVPQLVPSPLRAPWLTTPRPSPSPSPRSPTAAATSSRLRLPGMVLVSSKRPARGWRIEP